MTTTWRVGESVEIRAASMGGRGPDLWLPAVVVSGRDDGAEVEMTGEWACDAPVVMAHADLRRPSVPDVASAAPTRSAEGMFRAAPSPDVRPWRVGDACEVLRGGEWRTGEAEEVETCAAGFDVVHIEYNRDGFSFVTSEVSTSAKLRRPLTKPSADQAPAITVPAHDPAVWDGIAERLRGAIEQVSAAYAAAVYPGIPPHADRDVTPHNLSHWPSLCGCGAPAYESLLSRECSRGSECPVVAGEPEPERVEQSRLHIDGNGGAPRWSESGWRAEGLHVAVYHPTREGAIQAWRDRVRGGR